MRVIIFGASGMVGQGVLRECLIDSTVEHITLIGRQPGAANRPGDLPNGGRDYLTPALAAGRLIEIVQPDLFSYSNIEAQLVGFDACFFCLGVPSAGKKEVEYSRLTYDLTVNAAHTLSRLNPQLTFVYVSGAGADSTERGKSMWARVRGKTENALLGMPFKAAYVFRPGMIQPLNGARSRTALYRRMYAALGPLMSLLRRLWPETISTTEQIGRAMLVAARRGAPKAVLESRDIEHLARSAI